MRLRHLVRQAVETSAANAQGAVQVGLAMLEMTGGMLNRIPLCIPTPAPPLGFFRL